MGVMDKFLNYMKLNDDDDDYYDSDYYDDDEPVWYGSNGSGKKEILSAITP